MTWREPWRIFPGANIFTTDILHTFLLERDRINLFCSLFLDGKFQTSRCTASKQQRVAQHACLHRQQLILQLYTWFTNFIGACGNIVGLYVVITSPPVGMRSISFCSFRWRCVHINLKEVVRTFNRNRQIFHFDLFR